MNRDHAKNIVDQIRGLDPGLGEAMRLIDLIEDEAERNAFDAAVGNILYAQNQLIRIIVRQHRDLEEDFSRLDEVGNVNGNG
jgi:hypothetical protein